MLKRIASFVLILCVVYFTAATVYAADRVVFGPAGFTVNSFHFHCSLHRFSCPEGGAGTFVLSKATPDRAISAGFVVFNNTLMPLGDFLTGTAFSHEESVTLESNNTIIVFLVGSPGAVLNGTATLNDAFLPPTVDFSAHPTDITAGEHSTLSWSTTDAESVSIDNGIGNVPRDGSLIVSPVETTTYTLTATGPGGIVSRTVTLAVNWPLPSVAFSAEPTDIVIGETATLSWSSTYADACEIDHGIGTVGLAGSLTVSPDVTTTYTITAVGPGGSTSGQTTVAVTYPLPAVEITAAPSSIIEGDTAELTWTSTYAETCAIEPGIGTVGTAGSISVAPVETTLYRITAEGPGGTAADTVQVAVMPRIPTVSITASPDVIQLGEAAVLAWNSSNVDKVYIDNGIGDVSLEGTITLSPCYTTAYTIVASGPLGVASARAVVTVLGNPEPQPEGSFGTRYEDLVPQDATIARYNPTRFSVITGLVQASDGSPLPDVSIYIWDHPEYGHCMTDTTGRFSIPVEGGDTLTLVYRKTGLLTSHRKVYVPWNDCAVAKTIRMIVEDELCTDVAFDGNPDTVVTHRSTDVVDDFGSRACTMVFAGDNMAYLVDEEGNDIHELTHVTVRATEFTTPDSMPAILPPNSAYTYCAELNVDGVERVRFDKPVVVWVDNFLGFDVGEIVPVGYYDRAAGKWIPSDNGVVVKLLDTDADGIVDALDADGDNQPDDLNNDGSFVDEVRGLENGSAYVPGSTFWRFSVSHFTALDCNWPYGLPFDATLPDLDGVPYVDGQKKEDCPNCNSSYTEDRSRVFHEDIPVPGTDLNLHYTSNRVAGYQRKIIVPASGSDIPDSVENIIVKVEVAGRVLTQILEPLPDQKAEIVWDGYDHRGKFVAASTTAHIRLGFEYNPVYQGARDNLFSFGQDGTGATSIVGREKIILWRFMDMKIPGAAGTVAEGWTLSSHHSLQPADPTVLYKGDGSTIENTPSVVDTVAGSSARGYTGDGGPATEAALYYPTDVAVDGEGKVYIALRGNNVIRMVDTHGIITTVAGDGIGGFGGDGGPATEAKLNWPYGVAVDASGNLYIADYYNHRIRKVDQDGIITTVAGSGPTGSSGGGYGGDNGPATEALLKYPYAVAADSEGNLYIADMGNHRIRKVDPNGIITTTAGTGAWGYGGDGGPARDAMLANPCCIAVDNSGNQYIADGGNSRIRKVDASGTITTVAGNGIAGYTGDEGLATDARIYVPGGVAVDAAGNIYIGIQYYGVVRKVNTTGIITTVIGNGTLGYGGDEGLALDAKFCDPSRVAVDARSDLYIADFCNHRVRKIGAPSAFSPYSTSEDISFVDSNGLGYVMAYSGTHKKTIDLDSGVVLLSFDYDENNNLTGIADRFGNTTIIEHNNDGVPIAIVSPDGITTTLTIDANNFLTAVTYPDGSQYRFEYTADGLLTTKTEPGGNCFRHTFDSEGRLTDATDDAGGHWHYTQSVLENNDILTELATAEGNITAYLDHEDSTGNHTSIITDPTGAETHYAKSGDGMNVDKFLPCGMTMEFTYDIDPEYQYLFVTQMNEATPDALEKITERHKTYQDIDSDDAPDLITETIAVNENITTMENDILQAKKTITTPEGRTVTAFYNSENLLTTCLSTPGLYDTTYGYDARGRLASVATNARQTTFTYDSEGFLASVTNPGNDTTYFKYDPVGRMTGITRPDGSYVSFAYDGNGNMTLLTTPSSIDHAFGFNSVNLNSSYTAPMSGSYGFVYDRDRRLIRVDFPSGRQINNIYETTQLTQVQTPEGTIDFTYLCGAKIGEITNGTDTITYGYDGSLVTSETMGGTINQTNVYTYNADFNVESITYAGSTEVYAYDNDGLLTGAGNLAIARNVDTGFPETVTGGSLTLERSFNGYGEIATHNSTVNGTSVTSWNLSYDVNGRITHRGEIVAGVPAEYIYTYDAMGRLLTVTKDGDTVEEYRYDANGTRNYEMNVLRGIDGRAYVYSDEDHLLSAGDATYAYNVDGYLVQKSTGADVTNYEYSTRGELLGVTLSDGKNIEYVHDPLGRRIAKQVNGVTVEKYLWQGLTRLLAVYDCSDNLLMRFEYADGRMPVAMTKDGIRYYLVYDQVGSLRVVADAAGNVVKQIDYDSFGNIVNDTNQLFAVPFAFAGGLYDRDTGLIRFGYRDYDPDVGRWTAKDPILFAGGDTDLYGYCIGNPVSFVDPSGEFVFLLFSSGCYTASMALADSAIMVGVSWTIQQVILSNRLGKVTDYEVEKRKFKIGNQCKKISYGGPCKEYDPGPDDECEKLGNTIKSKHFKKYPWYVRYLTYVMFFVACG